MDEEKIVEGTETPEAPIEFAGTDLPPAEGKPVGMATIVEDDPAEQFPAHDENLSSQ